MKSRKEERKSERRRLRGRVILKDQRNRKECWPSIDGLSSDTGDQDMRIGVSIWESVGRRMRVLREEIPESLDKKLDTLWN